MKQNEICKLIAHFDKTKKYTDNINNYVTIYHNYNIVPKNVFSENF